VLKTLDEETRVALVNVQGFTPLKMLYRGVDFLMINRWRNQMLKATDLKKSL
jgi:hypothetical protein